MNRKSIDERQGIIREILKQKPSQTQESIREELEQRGVIVSRPVVGRDLKVMGWEHIDGIYRIKEDKVIAQKRETLRQFVQSEIPLISLHRNIHMITVKCKPGMEQPFATMIFGMYAHIMTGIFPGIGCVLILLVRESNARKIIKELRSYRDGKTKRTVVEQELDTSED